MTYNQADNPILKHSFNFAIEILKLTDDLQEKRKFTIANQLSKSGTSIGANIYESQSAESKADFIHKLKFLLRKPRKRNTGY